jgi:hypothetical protein
MVSPDTSTVYGELTDWTTESGSFWIEAALNCLRAFSDGMVSIDCRRTNIN